MGNGKKALITGASSGIGRDMARLLGGMGYGLILVSRNGEKLGSLARELPGETQIICLDLSAERACFELYDRVKDENVEILINNAGFGLLGGFDETDLSGELNMIDLNVRAVHILTKLFLHDFIRRDSGYILNVASSAAFIPGPLMACYYATKAYVLRLTQSVCGELKRQKSRVYLGALCPGPVDTGFGARAGVDFGIRGLSSAYVAKYAVKGMFRRKAVIVPGLPIRIGLFLSRFVPWRFLCKIVFSFQKGKKAAVKKSGPAG